MAATKIASLVIKTLSKPIAASIKQQAHQHERFRQVCIALAQYIHRTEMTMRLNLLAPHASNKNVQEQLQASSKDKEKEKATDQSHKELDKDGTVVKEEGSDASKDKSSHSSSSHYHEKQSAPRWRIFSSSAFAPSRAIRPLNDAKALEKGAQAFSEFFLFAVAALLIIAENYRGSRKRRKQRDETEEKVDVLAECVKVLVERLEERGVVRAGGGGGERDSLMPAWEEIEAEASRRRASADGDEGEQLSQLQAEGSQEGQDGVCDSSIHTSARSVEPYTLTSTKVHPETEQLQAAVALLLRLALRNGWIEGAEALRLDDILSGRPTLTSSAASSPPTPSISSPLTSSSPYNRPAGLSPIASEADAGTEAGADANAVANRSEILEAVALARARALAREVRYGSGDEDARSGGAVAQAESLSLAELMQRAGLTPAPAPPES